MTDYTPLLKRFPVVTLPKEVVSSRDVREPNSVYIAQPCGKRAFAWFTYHKNKNVCFLLDIKDRVAVNIYPVHAAFASSLALGTVLHGTITHHQGTRCFVADNIFHLRGTPFDECYESKLETLKTLMATDIDNRMYLPTQVMFSLPVYSYNPTSFDTIYKLYCVKCVQLNGPKIVNYQDRTAVWSVQPCDTCDTYELFNDAGVSQGLACVDTYKRSVFLNDLFRSIPENHNLDKIEESDDENGCVTTSLPLLPGASIKMFCRWHPMHKQWVPLSLVS